MYPGSTSWPFMMSRPRANRATAHLLQPRLRRRLQRAYYSYIWSEVLDADTRRFRRELLALGGAVDPMQAYEAFRGRAPDVTPLLVRRGLQS